MVTGNLPSLSFANVYGGLSNNQTIRQPPAVPPATLAQSANYQPLGEFGSTASWIVLVVALVAIRLLYEYAD
jgi:hypothetical protein